MSKILPIKSTLDDRFINETDVITEQALTQVIEGQGGTGGGGIIIWNGLNGVDPEGFDTDYCSTIEECAQKSGFTVAELEQIFAGKICMIIDGMASITQPNAKPLARCTLPFTKTGSSSETDELEYDYIYNTGGSVTYNFYFEHGASPYDYLVRRDRIVLNR